MPHQSNTVVARVFNLMKIKGLNTNSFAKKIKVTQSTLSSLKNNKSGDVKSNVIIGIKEAFPEVSLDWLIMGEGEICIEEALNPDNLFKVVSNLPDYMVAEDSPEYKIASKEDLYWYKYVKGNMEQLLELYANRFSPNNDHSTKVPK